MVLTNCQYCGRKTTFTEIPNKFPYDRTEWIKCDNCGGKHFRIGSSFGF